MKNWSDTKDPLTGRCAWRTERKNSTKIASQLGIPLITWIWKTYREEVINKMFEKYKKKYSKSRYRLQSKDKISITSKEAKKLRINILQQDIMQE